MTDNDPKNLVVINPCFRRQIDWLDPTSDTDAKALCDDLSTALQGWCAQASKEVTVTAYNLEGAKPNYPKASTTRAGSPLIQRGPGQIATCLSFYSGLNQPRKRGRLYLSGHLLSNTATDWGNATVPTAMQTKVAALPPIFSSLGGINVDWIVWSRVLGAAGRVDNWWQDDSWDVIRSRKMKATARTTGTTSG